MVYQLKCGVCGTESKIEIIVGSDQWNCPVCKNDQTSSIPVDKVTGAVLENIGQGGAIAKDPATVIGTVITGTKTDEIKNPKPVTPSAPSEPIFEDPINP